MTRHHCHVLVRGLVIALLSCAGCHTFGAAATPQALVDEGRLELAIELTPRGAVVPGQKLALGITIATDRWFTGGTRITLPEVPGLVILQTEQFATNASERRGDQDWVQQRWTLDVFPQRAGNFTIPPITARVKVNAGEGADLEGAVKLPALDITVVLPDALADVEQWVAAREFTVRQSFDRELDSLQVGDAFEQVIVFEASDVMAMMLPSASVQQMPGLAAYPAPPVLDNSNNRGEARASRKQRISYVVQVEGQYVLGAADYFWWDTRTGELRVLSLPATEITVGKGAAPDADATTAVPVNPRQLIISAAALALLLAVLWLVWRYLPRIPLGRLASAWRALQQRIHILRKPALPEQLNPGSNAGE